jgi:hypothetical protein
LAEAVAAVAVDSSILMARAIDSCCAAVVLLPLGRLNLQGSGVVKSDVDDRVMVWLAPEA